jgi:ADP-ribose pyrophosphatase YjhB (NUDIX family)
MERRLAVRGIIFKNGKLLCARLKFSESTSSAVQFWCVPGGGLDSGESLKDCLTREMIEETGIKPLIGELLFVQQYVASKSKREELEFFFNVLNPDDYLNIDLSKTTHGDLEIEEIGFQDPGSINLLPKFLTRENIVAQIEKRLPTKFYSYL